MLQDDAFATQLFPFLLPTSFVPDLSQADRQTRIISEYHYANMGKIGVYLFRRQRGATTKAFAAAAIIKAL